MLLKNSYLDGTTLEAYKMFMYSLMSFSSKESITFAIFFSLNFQEFLLNREQNVWELLQELRFLL